MQGGSLAEGRHRAVAQHFRVSSGRSESDVKPQRRDRDILVDII